ncbi:hypothetical protein BLOT_011359 [Blomia tropicalis]|nr:hypothetical protein BLOT_011359 [Blomia tropicalis]
MWKKAKSRIEVGDKFTKVLLYWFGYSVSPQWVGMIEICKDKLNKTGQLTFCEESSGKIKDPCLSAINQVECINNGSCTKCTYDEAQSMAGERNRSINSLLSDKCKGVKVPLNNNLCQMGLINTDPTYLPPFNPITTSSHKAIMIVAIIVIILTLIGIAIVGYWISVQFKLLQEEESAKVSTTSFNNLNLKQSNQQK